MDINPYGNAIGHVAPGTFVPDMAPAAPAAQPLPESDNSATTSFRDTVKSMLSDVNDKIVGAQQQSVDYATGKTNDLDKTVKSLEEASLAFQFTQSIRNKLMEAYTEVQQMQF